MCLLLGLNETLRLVHLLQGACSEAWTWADWLISMLKSARMSPFLGQLARSPFPPPLSF